jgi:ATP-dependent helicase YprA (DUF1998 family)
MIFDARAGGSGICSELWKHVFIPNGLVHSAIDLLESCASCNGDRGYHGGCPACIQFGECIKFNDFLCKTKGLLIAKRLLERIQKTDLYKANCNIEAAEPCTGNEIEGESLKEVQPSESSSPATAVKSRTRDETDLSSPRRIARAKALRTAKNMASARDRQLVIGRPSWPMDRSNGPSESRDHEHA